MNKPIKHIIIARLLVVIINMPLLWQLEHVFDNNHGIVYASHDFQITKVSDSHCFLLHKQILGWFWFKPYAVFIQKFFSHNEIITASKKITPRIFRSFQERSPPVNKLV